MAKNIKSFCDKFVIFYGNEFIYEKKTKSSL